MTPSTTYIVRLDDACPTMKRAAWRAVEAVLDRHGVRPIVAVVADNVDPLLACEEPDPDFWDGVRAWKAKGWLIGLHGWRHEAAFRHGGLFHLHTKSEFAGGALEEQRRRLKAAMDAFRRLGVTPDLWVAPFHTFDRTTLAALKVETPLRVISDGLAAKPYAEEGFFWLPQQLWAPDRRGPGVWTICLHPNTISAEALERLDRFIDADRAAFQWTLDALSARYLTRRRGPGDHLFMWSLLVGRHLDRLSVLQGGRRALSAAKRWLVVRLGAGPREDHSAHRPEL